MIARALAGPSQPAATIDAATIDAATVVPRWEWRTFTRDAHTLASLHTYATAHPEGASDERYFLAAPSPHNAKLRDGFLEIKELIDTSPSGFEQWRPVARDPFPLDTSAVARLFRIWGIAPPVLMRADYSLDVFERDVIAPDARLAVVSVLKRRTRLTVAGCPGELVRLAIRGERWLSAAFEHRDVARVAAAVEQAGLTHLVHTNYPAALKRVAGLPSANSRRP